MEAKDDLVTAGSKFLNFKVIQVTNGYSMQFLNDVGEVIHCRPVWEQEWLMWRIMEVQEARIDMQNERIKKLKEQLFTIKNSKS